MLNIDTRLRLIPTVCQLRNSRLAATRSSRHSSSVQHDPPRNSLRSTLDHMRSSPDLAPIQSHYDFRTAFALYIQSSTSSCWNPPSRTRSLVESSHHHRRSWSTMNPSLKSQKYWTQKSTIAVTPANYSTSSAGQVTKALMKKLHGYLLPS